MASTSRKRDVLASLRDFPPFSDLPVDNGLDEDYYQESLSGVWVYSRTWCFIAEIYDDSLPPIPIRRRVLVRDRLGEELPIFFYPECGCFDYSTLKNGRTVAILFAERHHFLDLSVGLRIENLDTIKVVSSNLEDLFAMSNCYAKCGDERCWYSQCGEKRVAEEIKKCGSCWCARYCNKQCQTNDWKERHKRWCKALPLFMKLASIDYSRADRVHGQWQLWP